jgi:hypothetical protein
MPFPSPAELPRTRFDPRRDLEYLDAFYLAALELRSERSSRRDVSPTSPVARRCLQAMLATRRKRPIARTMPIASPRDRPGNSLNLDSFTPVLEPG